MSAIRKVIPFLRLWGCGDGRGHTGGIYTGGDVVLLVLPLVVPYHQSCRTRGGEVRHDGRAKGYHQVLEEVPHAVVHSHCCIHFLFLLSVSFQVLGEAVPIPPIPDF